MGYRNKAIGATKGGLGCAESSAAVEKILLTCPKTVKNARRNAPDRLEERSRYALGIGQRSVSMYSTNNDDGVANSQRVGEGCKPKLECACQACQKAKGNPWV